MADLALFLFDAMQSPSFKVVVSLHNQCTLLLLCHHVMSQCHDTSVSSCLATFITGLCHPNCRFVRCIGVGEFGRVCMGYWNTKGYRRKVAIKTLNLQAEEQDRIRFLQEAAIMAQFRHPNIVNLFGVVKEGEPVSEGCLL